MNRKEHLFTIISEECNEVGQRASKALRFGVNEVQPGQELTNAQRLIYEFSDLMAVMEMLVDEGHLPYVFDRIMIEKKKKKIEEYIQYSKIMGTLTPDCKCAKHEVCEICYMNPLSKVETVSPAY